MKLSDHRNIGKPCPKCKRPITREVLERAYEDKVHNAIWSLEKAKENGNIPGRKSTVDWEKVKQMRNKHMKITAIAKIIGVSRPYLSREFSKRGIR